MNVKEDHHLRNYRVTISAEIAGCVQLLIFRNHEKLVRLARIDWMSGAQKYMQVKDQGESKCKLNPCAKFALSRAKAHLPQCCHAKAASDRYRILCFIAPPVMASPESMSPLCFQGFAGSFLGPIVISQGCHLYPCHNLGQPQTPISASFGFFIGRLLVHQLL